jgi:hypothetical protein
MSKFLFIYKNLNQVSKVSGTVKEGGVMAGPEIIGWFSNTLLNRIPTRIKHAQ